MEKYLDKTMCELSRNDIFKFKNKNIRYRVSFIFTQLIGREEFPTKVKAQSLKSNRFYIFDLNKRFDYNGAYCEFAFRRVEVYTNY